jgi:hypothetical protein
MNGSFGDCGVTLLASTPGFCDLFPLQGIAVVIELPTLTRGKDENGTYYMNSIELRTLELRLVLIFAFATVFTSCGGGGGTASPPALPPPPANIAPIVDAGSNLTVGEQTKVDLIGSASDSDGTISSYNWTQTSGIAVKLNKTDTAETSFDAPAVSRQATLIFQLTATDNAGGKTSDTVEVTVNSNPVSLIANWEPSLISECTTDSNISPVLSLASDFLTQDGQRVMEPSIIFIDQTFTLLLKAPPDTTSLSLDLLKFGGYGVVGDDDVSLVFDDGTHGDLVAGDGIFTRSCLYLRAESLAGNDYVQSSNLWTLSDALRGTETANYIAQGIRVNDAGFFIELGDEYSNRLTSNWRLLSPETCQACLKAWQLAGDIFDFFAMSTRDPAAGAGYVRVHDNILGTGFNPPCEPRSYCYSVIDGQEHQKLTGIIWMGWPGLGGLNHELGHGFLGVETRNFPADGARAWNAGDLFHLDSDITVTGELSGPFWDPVRGWPHAVQLENEAGERSDTYLIEDVDGTFRLKELDDNNRIWDDILLYMMGLLSPEEVTKTYYKLFNPSLSGCVTEEINTVCTNDLVTAEELIPFTVTDFIAQFGARSVPPYLDPKRIQMGVLNISDRPHTEAEIVWLTKAYREFTTSSDAAGQLVDGTPWSWATKGLSTIDINAELQTNSN